MTSVRPAKRILWVDDEVAHLRPHCLFLEQRGYHVDAIANGDDALALLRDRSYDLVLLDEQMPGRRGLEVLEILRRDDPHARVVMITKSEEDRTMTEAIGRRVDDYLVKPTSPRQLLSVVTRILEGPAIRQQQVAQDFAAAFRGLERRREAARSAEDFMKVFSELTDWNIRLEAAGESGLLDSVKSLVEGLRRDFGAWVRATYPSWMKGRANPPMLSTDVVRRCLLPVLSDEPVLFVVLDCMRLDQWRVMLPLLNETFEVEEGLYLSILPSATPFSRNAIFSGSFPDEISRARPGWWEGLGDEGSMNAFEGELLEEQLRSLTGRNVPVHYEKVFTDRDGERLRARVNSALAAGGGVIALVFSFMDLLIHSRSESPVFMEVARDESSLRDLARSWLERSMLLQILEEVAAQGIRVVLTSDHGSIHCNRPTTVFARRDVTPGLRFKFGHDLRAEDPDAVLATSDPEDLRLPPDRQGIHYLLALDDHFFVYPTKLREYQKRYRGAFLHGGVSPEEMIIPVATLTPRPR
jgi:CheY-like chemotaxis protein